jgi:hypothetical protein
MRKYETIEIDFWKEVYKFIESQERGIKLMRLVKVERDPLKQGGAPGYYDMNKL